MKPNKSIIISAINLYEGGPLSILKDCLTFLNDSFYVSSYLIIALVHKKEIFDLKEYPNITFIEFPKSRKSYFYRLYYEYFYFKKFAIKKNVFFWLSLHDITPFLNNINQAVYCHNPSPFNYINFKEILVQPTQFFFTLFYKNLYAINIKSNKKIIVQQKWIKEEFQKMFSINENKIIVAPPQVPAIPQVYIKRNESATIVNKTFFFPTFPRPFKNIEIICEAVKILNSQKISNFKLVITVDGSENKYSKSILDKYQSQSNIYFIGLISREKVYENYAKSDCLIFPSKLETWGLPISEFKQFNKPILAANLPYAKETIGNYKISKFFDPNCPSELAKCMKTIIMGNTIFNDDYFVLQDDQMVAKSWSRLFEMLLS